MSKACRRGRRVCQSHPDLCCGGSNWNFRVDDISLWYERPWLPFAMWSPTPGIHWLASLPPPPKKCHLYARDEGGMLPKLRFKEAKSAFMGNYANLCSKIGVEKPFHLKTVAKLPSLIGNLFQVGLCLLSSPTLTDKSYLLQPRGY